MLEIAMRKFGRKLVVALALVAAVGLTPGAAQAVGYEDSLDDCDYPKTFDLLVMRPVSFMALSIGTVLFVPAAPMALATVPRDFHQIAENLIYSPARFTFQRRLGECVGVTLAY